MSDELARVAAGAIVVALALGGIIYLGVIAAAAAAHSLVAAVAGAVRVIRRLRGGGVQ